MYKEERGCRCNPYEDYRNQFTLPCCPGEPLHGNFGPLSSFRPNPPTCMPSAVNRDVVIEEFSPVFPSPFPQYPSHCNESRVTLKQPSYNLLLPISPIRELSLSPKEYLVFLNSPVTMANSPKYSDLTPLKHQKNPFIIPNTDLCSFPSQIIPYGKNSYQSFSDENHFVLPENWKEIFNKAPSTHNNSLQNSINVNNPTHNLILGKSHHRNNSLSAAIHTVEVNQGEKPLNLGAYSLVCSPPYMKIPSPTPIVSQKSRGRWVRPLRYAEKFMSKAHEYGCMTTIYAVWLNSKRPIPFSFIKQAASIMFR
ncbi:uncharacterized protein [Palaemon carinicauda]|uniref:uncharacterized protein n=1 Tax=Palaemon carinicauda TaxID=392227 RepID=UPI0035B58597